MNYLAIFTNLLDKLIVKQIDPVKKAQFFGLMFKTLPTYQDLVGRNQNSPLFTGVNPLSQAIAGDNFPMVNLRGPTWKTYWDSFIRLSEQLEDLGVGDEVK